MSDSDPPSAMIYGIRLDCIEGICGDGKGATNVKCRSGGTYTIKVPASKVQQVYNEAVLKWHKYNASQKNQSEVSNILPDFLTS